MSLEIEIHAEPHEGKRISLAGSLDTDTASQLQDKIDQDLIHQLLRADDFRVRAATVRVLRYAGHQMEDQPLFLREAARDDHGRVRLEAIVAASWLERDLGMPVLTEAAKISVS